MRFLGMGPRKDRRTADKGAPRSTPKKPRVAGPNPFKRQAGADDGERKKKWRSVKQLLDQTGPSFCRHARDSR
jgi:hypothetical protein